MKNEKQVRDLLEELRADRLALGRRSTLIVAKPSAERSLGEQRFLHAGSGAAALRAIDLQIELLEHILH